MSEREQMKTALLTYFVPALEKLGFTGCFPHFRRITDKRVDLLSVVFDKWGGSFLLEISYALLEGAESNLIQKQTDVNPEDLTVFKTEKRLRLPENGDYISFCDLVRIRSESGYKVYSLTENQKKAFLRNLSPEDYTIIHTASSEVYKSTAEMAAGLLENAQRWWSTVLEADKQPENKGKVKKKSGRSLFGWLAQKKEKTG